MKVLISGSTGLIGSALRASLESTGDAVIPLVRSGGESSGRLVWDPSAATLDAGRLEELAPDAVIHLAGESIGTGRWTASKKARIRDSRVRGTRTLSEALARLGDPPRALISASAVGWYGSRGAEPLSETSGRGSGFLADVTEAWEAATEPAAAAGIRVVRVRFGIVLSPKGGALARMLPPFRLGLGGPFGSGGQYMSWVSLDDVVGIVRHVLDHDPLEGPVNTVAPNPVKNREFVRTLGRVLRRPAVIPIPAPALRLALGEFADESLLAGARVLPARLMASGYRFRHPVLEPALRDLLAPRG